MAPWRAVEVRNRGLEAQNGDLESLQTTAAGFETGSALK
jgi:hypothetical protein